MSILNMLQKHVPVASSRPLGCVQNFALLPWSRPNKTQFANSHSLSNHLPNVQRQFLCRSQTAQSAEPSSSTDPEAHKRTFDIEPQYEGEYCMPGEISVDNSSNPRFTVFELEVKDYPGLLRVIAWVLNGLGLLVQNAKLRTDEDGFARNVLWVSNTNGQKLTDGMADLVGERMGDFISYCTPDEKALKADEFRSGPIVVSNKEHESLTVLTIQGVDRVGFLLEVASALSGIGVLISEAIIQGCTSCGTPVEEEDFDKSEGRLFKFWVTDRSGQKLDYTRAAALLYTLGLLFGKDMGLLHPPNSNFH